MKFPRRSGVILHPTSLPGPFGIGDLGEAAYAFVDWLAQAGQSYWQVLPLSPTGYGDSPYQGLTAFAGNPLLISPARLVAEGLLSPRDLASVPHFPPDRVDFGRLIPWKTELLALAYSNFKAHASGEARAAFDSFCTQEADWLEDAALFLTLKETHQRRPWYEWEPELARREPGALAQARIALADDMRRQMFLQWQFAKQWSELKAYANAKGIAIIGDIPIYVALDCADVWANTRLFCLDADLNPTAVSGVPPDYFSATGQLWGHPLYRWEVMEQEGYAWWIARFKHILEQADVVRVDHFRGFYNYWQVPAGETTAIHGSWCYGPGAAFFRALTAALGGVRIIAEDLGDFDAESRAGLDALMHEFGYPGMKVLQFAFGGSPQAEFLPHNYPRECVVYTGTHDNDTIVGWWATTSERERAFARKYLDTDGLDIAWDLIRAAWASVANTAMTTVQDLLRLGSEARFNFPGTTGPPNWCWRLHAGALNDTLAAQLYALTEIYGRTAPSPTSS
ncbi:MAG: 4-alpha-glucanotransferase [candidate division KSB1 bacterium]|nr:4-alpha-glucanotransferase [candidate division KSB1 bacterium]